MTQLPASSDQHPPRLLPGPDGYSQGAGIPISDLAGMLSRNKWLILLCTIAVTAGAAYFTAKATPIYEASASLRLDEKESSLPDIFKTVAQKGAVETETEVLQSRSFAEAAGDELALRLRLVEPSRVTRRATPDGLTYQS